MSACRRTVLLLALTGFAIFGCSTSVQPHEEGCVDSAPMQTDESPEDSGGTDDTATVGDTDTVDTVSATEDTGAVDTHTAPATDGGIFDAAVFADLSANEAAPLFSRQEVVEVRLSLPPDEWEALITYAVEEQYTAADVTIMGETVANIGLRFKGAYGTLYPCFDDDNNLICPKLGMKLKFDEYVDAQRFLGLKRLNLHSGVTDDTMIRDCLAYDLFRDAGIVSPRCAFSFVYVNDEALGLFITVEQVDGRFTDSRFKQGDGNLYKEAWPVSTRDGYYEDHIKTNEETAVHDAFKQFSTDMMRADDEGLPGALNAWVDLDYWLRYMAVDYAIANWDGITTFYCGADWPCVNHNYYLYQVPTANRFWIIPWDLSASFFLDHWLGDVEPWDNLDAACDNTDIVEGKDWYIRPASCDPTNRAIALTDHARYAEAVQMVLDTLFDEGEPARRTDAMADLIAPWVAADPNLDLAAWQDAVAWHKDELSILRERLEAAPDR